MLNIVTIFRWVRYVYEIKYDQKVLTVFHIINNSYHYVHNVINNLS